MQCNCEYLYDVGRGISTCIYIALERHKPAANDIIPDGHLAKLGLKDEGREYFSGSRTSRELMRHMVNKGQGPVNSAKPVTLPPINISTMWQTSTAPSRCRLKCVACVEGPPPVGYCHAKRTRFRSIPFASAWLTTCIFHF